MKLRNMASIYLSCGGEILLLYRRGSRVVNDVWVASAGGHFEEGELNSPRSCMLRELREELGLEEDALRELRLRYITLRQKGGEIRQIYYYFAEIADKSLVKESAEGSLRWLSMDEVLSLPMPFTAREVMEHYLHHGRYDKTLYAGATLPEGIIFRPLEEFEGK